MKGNEVTQKDIAEWAKQRMIPTACRLCGEIELFPRNFYKPNELKAYECANCITQRKTFIT